MPQEVSQLVQGQASVKDLLSEVQQEQSILIKTTALATDRLMLGVVESREHLGKTMDGAKADARDGEKRLGERVAGLTDDLRKNAEQMTDFASAVASGSNELNSRLENGFATFQQQAEIDRAGLVNALHSIHKRFLWLSILCSLSLIASTGLVASRFM
jgi:hypothetical protein